MHTGEDPRELMALLKDHDKDEIYRPHGLQLQDLAIEAVGYSHYYERSP